MCVSVVIFVLKKLRLTDSPRLKLFSKAIVVYTTINSIYSNILFISRFHCVIFIYDRKKGCGIKLRNSGGTSDRIRELPCELETQKLECTCKRLNCITTVESLNLWCNFAAFADRNAKLILSNIRATLANEWSYTSPGASIHLRRCFSILTCSVNETVYRTTKIFRN